MATEVALQTCSSVLQSGSCSRRPVGFQTPNNGAMWSLKILSGVSLRNQIHGRRSCSRRAQVSSPEKTQQPGISGTAKAEAAATAAPGVIEERTYGRQYFPLAAVVGQDATKSALLLGTVDGARGGIALSGQRGTAKTIMARGLHALLRPIEIVSGSIANADVNCPEEWEAGLDDKLEYNHDGSIKVEVIKAPFVQIPLRITKDHLLGSIDVEESIKTGMTVFQPGLLADAHRGVLYVDGINLLNEGVSNLLLNVLNEGVNIVEREGVSFRHPCKPLLIATYNPDEGAVQEDLLDRIAINLSVDNEMTFDDHVDAVKIATQFQESAKQVVGDVTSATEILKTQVILGREWLKDVTISKEQIKYVVMGALRGDSQGHHAELIPVRVAKRFAALEGREDVDRKDKQEVQQQQELQFSATKGSKSPKRFAVSQGRRVQTLAGYTAMVVMYTRMGQYREAEKMIEEMDFHEVLPDKSNWLARITAYGQQGKVREAEKAFKGMQESGILPNTMAFHSLILLYGKARMYDRAYSTFRKMLENGGTPDVYTFRSMVGACGKSGKLKDALQLFAEMRELKFCPSLQNFCTLINLYGKARNAGGIVRVIQEMKESGCKPDAHTLDACLRAMKRAGKLLKNLDKLLHSLKDAGWSADAASYSPLLNAYLKCHMHKEALETFRLMRKANQIPKDGLCRELISQCKDAGKVEEAEYVFYEVEDLGITPSLETTCTMINALGMIGKVQEAERLYNKLRTAGVKLDIVVYNVMISVYMRAGLTRDAARIFETVGQQPCVCPDSYTFHGMLRVYQKARLYQEAIEVYWKMVDSRIKLDEGLLNCVINCCGRALPLDETSRLFQAMLDAGFSPNNVTFNLMIDIYGKAGMLERACEVFNLSKEYGKVDSITYSILINFYGKQRDFANMEAIAWEMQRRGLGRWVEAYNSIIDAYGKAGLLTQMEEVLERLQRAGCIGDVITYNILINVYGKKGTMQDLESVLEDMEEAGQKRDLWTYNTLIGIYGHAEVPSQVMSTFKEMQEVGIMPDRITYKNLVAAFEKSGNLWEAARWSLWMTQAGFSMDVGFSRG